MSIPNPLPPHDIPSEDDPEMDPSDERTAEEHPPSEADSRDVLAVPGEPAADRTPDDDRR